MPESKLCIERVVDVLLEENAYVVYERPGGACWIIDPSFEPQPQRIAALVRQRTLTPAAILLTHCHGDHIAGVDALHAIWPPVEILAPAAEAGALADPNENLSAAFGLDVRVRATATRLLKVGDTLRLGSSNAIGCVRGPLETLDWQVLDVSGHSPGGLAFYCPSAKVVFTGDALFAGSIGRTDIPGASEGRLLANLRANLLSLPDEVAVWPGHGPSTTIGQERRTNPFLLA